MMQQCSRLLMIEPVQFGYNEQTAINNSFQQKITGDIQQAALTEFKAFVALLEKNQVDVTVIKDSLLPVTPDALFPNNWLSFHEDNSIVLYPMFAANRRLERKEHILHILREKFVISTISDLSRYEQEGKFLEGTGSMVLDRINKIAYACLSARTDIEILDEFCKLKGYTPLAFHATDENHQEIYHTNVMMCVADSYAVICLDSIRNDDERNKVIASLNSTGKEIIPISTDQMNRFAGNMLQVISNTGELLLIMSEQAYYALWEDQKKKLGDLNRMIYTSLRHIETSGGGSARCMLAEVFNESVLKK